MVKISLSLLLGNVYDDDDDDDDDGNDDDDDGGELLPVAMYCRLSQSSSLLFSVSCQHSFQNKTLLSLNCGHIYMYQYTRAEYILL